jgi:hypothetical protein
LVLIDNDVRQTRTQDIESHERPRSDKCEEIAIIPTANTVIEPYTVVIVILDAVITNSTVVSSGWPPDIAGFAIFYRHLHGRICRRC